MTASVEDYQHKAPATVFLEKKGRKWIANVVCNDCGVVIGRYPDWFEHAPDCPQRKDRE